MRRNGMRGPRELPRVAQRPAHPEESVYTTRRGAMDGSPALLDCVDRLGWGLRHLGAPRSRVEAVGIGADAAPSNCTRPRVVRRWRLQAPSAVPCRKGDARRRTPCFHGFRHSVLDRCHGSDMTRPLPGHRGHSGCSATESDTRLAGSPRTSTGPSAMVGRHLPCYWAGWPGSRRDWPPVRAGVWRELPLGPGTIARGTAQNVRRCGSVRTRREPA